jgi:hypothetical protein
MILIYLFTTISDMYLNKADTVSKIESAKSKSFPISGNKFNQELIDNLNQLKSPCKLYIEDIKAMGADGSTRNLGSFSIRLIEDDNANK